MLFAFTVASAILQQGQGQGRAVPSGSFEGSGSSNRGRLRRHGGPCQNLVDCERGGGDDVDSASGTPTGAKLVKQPGLALLVRICRSIFKNLLKAQSVGMPVDATAPSL